MCVTRRYVSNTRLSFSYIKKKKIKTLKSMHNEIDGFAGYIFIRLNISLKLKLKHIKYKCDFT